MDLAYSTRDQELFFVERRSWRLRVWYVAKGRISAGFVHLEGLQQRSAAPQRKVDLRRCDLDMKPSLAQERSKATPQRIRPAVPGSTATFFRADATIVRGR
jgi:hypothetical protein